MKRKQSKPRSGSKDTAPLTHAQIEALVKENRWWPFTRVPAKILPKMHRSIVSGNPMTNVEEALL